MYENAVSEGRTPLLSAQDPCHNIIHNYPDVLIGKGGDSMNAFTRALKNPVIALGIGFVIAGIALGYMGEQTSELTVGLAFLVVGIFTEFLLPKGEATKETEKQPAPPPPQSTP
jgi:hypothetical protein